MKRIIFTIVILSLGVPYIVFAFLPPQPSPWVLATRIVLQWLFVLLLGMTVFEMVMILVQTARNKPVKKHLWILFAISFVAAGVFSIVKLLNSGF